MSGRTLELTRSQRDRRVYVLDGVGTLRLEGLGSGRAKAAAGVESWTFSRRFWTRVGEATDGTGAMVGDFEPRLLRRGGALRWGDRELLLRPASHWRERYALVEGDRELALFDGKSWGKRPVRVTRFRTRSTPVSSCSGRSSSAASPGTTAVPPPPPPP